MKKAIAFVIFQLFVFFTIYGAAMDARKGYADLTWGSSVTTATKEGFKLTPMDSVDDKAFLERMYTVPVDGYTVKTKDKMVVELQFHYHYGKLFAVSELINLKELNQKKLESRYGKFADRGIALVNGQYIDAQIGTDGKVSQFSISISKPADYVLVSLHDWDVYKNISVVGQSLLGTAEKTIVEEFESIANKLIQENNDGSKPSFAFLPLTTDYKNTLVDNYVTDALTEAMFNTGAVKIMERANLEAILTEQKFQASGLVNEQTAKSIGMLAGVDYVCYGTLKDTGDKFVVNARVVDVETGEVCAITRGNITKDDYLKKQVQAAVGEQSGASSKTTSVQKNSSAVAVNNLWQVSSYRNEFDGFTSYTFTVKCASGEMLYVGYKKSDIQINSRVYAGIYWVAGNWSVGDDPAGTYDIKKDDGTTVTKKFVDEWKNYLDLSQKNFFYFGWNAKEGARWFLDLFTQNNMITLRRNNLVRKFQTSGLLDKMAEVGITWDEIDAAIANEEF